VHVGGEVDVGGAVIVGGESQLGHLSARNITGQRRAGRHVSLAVLVGWRIACFLVQSTATPRYGRICTYNVPRIRRPLSGLF